MLKIRVLQMLSVDNTMKIIETVLMSLKRKTNV